MKIKFSIGLTIILFGVILGSHAQAATIAVTEKTDSFDAGNCSLRDAVQSMNNDADFGGCSHTGPDYGTGDTILLESGDYVLSLTGGDTSAAGDLDICIQNNKDLLIQGQGFASTNITADFVGEKDRIIDINDCHGRTTLMDLTISNGGDPNSAVVNGAGILNSNFLILQGVQVRDNFGSFGGGIQNGTISEIQIFQSQITGNTGERGAGIFNQGNLFMDESTIDSNHGIDGGGINTDGPMMAIFNSTISRNTALSPLMGTGEVSGAGDPGNGGGIYLDICDINILVNTTISSNQTSFTGGGIRSVQSGCLAGAGAPVPPIRGTFLFNSTVASNQVLSPGGLGGGIFFFTAQNLVFSTGFPGDFPAVNLQSTILADNEAAMGPDCYNSIQSFGFNLIENQNDCQFIEVRIDPNVLGEDPQLGGLQNNGGPTETHALSETSPAIDMGNNNVAGCDAPELDEIINNNNFTAALLTRDQRNFPRPIAVRDPNNPLCDIGAFEFQIFDFTVTKDDGLAGATIPVGTVFDYTITVTNNGPGSAAAVTLNDPLPTGMQFDSVTPSQGTCSGDAVISCDLGDLALGASATITVTVTTTETGDFTNIVTITLNNQFQQQLTKTAEVTTTVGGAFVEGSGIHCELQQGAILAPPRLALVLGLMALTILGVHIVLRRRAFK